MFFAKPGNRCGAARFAVRHFSQEILFGKQKRPASGLGKNSAKKPQYLATKVVV
jgi:hypothetical protein